MTSIELVKQLSDDGFLTKMVKGLVMIVVITAMIGGITCNAARSADPIRSLWPAKKADPYRNVEARGQSVGELAELPNLPRFSGHCYFGFGYANLNAKGGPVYTMSYSAKEDAATVVAWYTETLRIMKWSVDAEACRSGYIAATDQSGNMVHIAVSHPDRLDCRCNFMIQYKVRQRTQ